ncbi:MAG: hypothetical protein NT157_00120, partial [Candidatus Micrarchaeota archaeon]|nr:hypothetical protein [Candidatus Micrarchaeota archaeon]
MTTSLDASKAVINEELLRRIAREIMDKTEMTEDDLRKILRGSVSYIEDEALLYAHNRARRFEMLPGFKELLYAHRMVEASFNARSNVDRAQSFETLPGFEEELSKTGPIFALQMRKQIAKQIGERLGIPIDYQGVDEIPLRQLKKGARVRIRGDSEYAHQTSGIGTMLNDFGEEGINSEGKWAKVEFDNGYRDRYRKRDLELARKLTNAEIRALEKKNEGVLERVKTQTFAQFLQEMERQVTQAIKSDKAVGSLGDLALGSMGEFQPGDKIRMNWKANGRYSITKEGNYSITKEGSEGVVL